MALVDAVLEEVRFGLEQNDYSQNQRRVAYVKYLGELYAYRLFNSQVLFDTLYLLITFGHYVNSNGALESRVDPPTDYFRIRLVITLLDAVGHYFDAGSGARRLDRFLLFFQRYLFLKSVIPIDVEFAIMDLFDKACPTLFLFDKAMHHLISVFVWCSFGQR